MSPAATGIPRVLEAEIWDAGHSAVDHLSAKILQCFDAKQVDGWNRAERNSVNWRQH